MYKQCLLKYGIAEILFYKRLDQVFALKCAAKLFKSAKVLNPSEKIKSSTRCFKSLLKGLKSSTECLKSLTTCLCYITTSAVLIRFFNPNLGEKLQSQLFAAFRGLLLETFVPNLVSLTCVSLKILGKTQTCVFPIYGFLINPS